MRIIAGKFKSKKILGPKDKNTRPLKDMVKESIFNIINHSNKFKMDIINKNILDLFSGTGSFGLEALSRGAEKVTFVENYKIILSVLKENIKNLNFEKKSNIIEKNIHDSLNFENLNQKYDIIFIDPPFEQKEIPFLLSKISNSNILKKNGLLIIHRKKNYEENLSEMFKVLEDKTYGFSRIFFGKFV